MEFLKHPLGEELYNQVVQALEGKNVKLADLSGGAYVGKEKYDALAAEKNQASQLAKDTKAALDALKAAGDPAQLATQLAEAQARAAQLEAEYTAKEKALRLDFAIQQAVPDAYDATVVAGKLDKSKLVLKDDGTVAGLEEQLTALRKDHAWMFQPADPSKPVFSGMKPAESGETRTGAAENPWLKEQWNITKQAIIYRQDPAKAKQLMAAAGIKIT